MKHVADVSMMQPNRINLPDGCMGLQLPHVRPPCLCGIDVRYASYDVVIADLVKNVNTGLNVLRPVFYGKVRDDIESLFVCQQYGVRFGLIDTRPEATLAKRMQEQAETIGIDLWRAQYNPTPGGTIEITKNESAMLVTLERTMTMDCVHHAFQTGQGIVLPQNYREVAQGQLCGELQGTTRISERRGGKDVYVWEKTGTADHAFHAFNLLLAAYKMSGLMGWAEETSPVMGVVESTMESNLAMAAHGDESVYFEA
jgi:hypothetical protein